MCLKVQKPPHRKFSRVRVQESLYVDEISDKRTHTESIHDLGNVAVKFNARKSRSKSKQLPSSSTKGWEIPEFGAYFVMDC